MKLLCWKHGLSCRGPLDQLQEGGFCYILRHFWWFLLHSATFLVFFATFCDIFGSTRALHSPVSSCAWFNTHACFIFPSAATAVPCSNISQLAKYVELAGIFTRHCCRSKWPLLHPGPVWSGHFPADHTLWHFDEADHLFLWSVDEL